MVNELLVVASYKLYAVQRDADNTHEHGQQMNINIAACKTLSA